MIEAIAALAILFAAGDDAGQAKRAATITRLQQVGANTAIAGACQIVGYRPSEEGAGSYWLEEGRFANEDGMSAADAATYIKLGMDGRGADILKDMRRHEALLDAGNRKAADAATVRFLKSLVEDCDLLASRSETLRLFEYVPPNAAAALSAGRARLGMSK